MISYKLMHASVMTSRQTSERRNVMFHVLSFDPKRIMVACAHDGKMIVRKKTTAKEHGNILLARVHILKHQPILVSKRYGEVRISVAEVLEWNQDAQLLSTLFCHGRNLEEILRETIGTNRGDLADLIRKLFETFKTNGFLWGDFAPRNMIWDQPQGIIWLVDFERNLYLKDCPVECRSFNRYVRNYSREEFSCFLTQHERSALLDDFLNEDTQGFIPMSHITSKRKTALLKSMFGEKECYSLNEVRQTEDIIASAATPFQVNNTFFFPMDSLDLIGNKGGPDEYVRTIIAIRDLGEYEKFSELKRRTKTL